MACCLPGQVLAFACICDSLHARSLSCMLGPYLAVWIACPALFCMLEHSYAPTPGAGIQVGLRSGWACMGGAVLQSPSPGSGSWFICKLCSIPRLSGVVLVLCSVVPAWAGLSLCYDSCWVWVVYSALAFHYSDSLFTLFQFFCRLPDIVVPIAFGSSL